MKLFSLHFQKHSEVRSKPSTKLYFENRPNRSASVQENWLSIFHYTQISHFKGSKLSSQMGLYIRGECKSGKPLNLCIFAFSLAFLFTLALWFLISIIRKHIKVGGGQKEFISGFDKALEGKGRFPRNKEILGVEVQEGVYFLCYSIFKKLSHLFYHNVKLTFSYDHTKSFFSNSLLKSSFSTASATNQT